ncbi:MAG: FAD-binding oxidoreductase [Pseudomonadota bacterium]
MTAPLSRRAFIRTSAALTSGAAMDAQARCPAEPRVVCNVTELYSVRVAQVVPVQNTEDVHQALKTWKGRISIGGGRYSMGGQTAIADGCQLDMRSMRRLLQFDPARKTVRVQAGMRWRDLQALIDPHGLAVQTMQSYANFTVGGSLSVNCHGRYVGHGPIVSSVRVLQMVLAHGEVLELSPRQEPELFYAAVGGYGGLGVITEVELQLDDNFPIERHTTQVALADYPAWFAHTVASDSTALLHNADLIAPSFDAPFCTTWRRSSKPLTVATRLRKTADTYLAEKALMWAMTELPGGTRLRRSIVQPFLAKPAVVWRNYEASLDVAALEPATRAFSSYVLQEYFIPVRHFGVFAKAMATLLQRNPYGTLNVSIRHSPADTHTLMAWAREECFSFVLFYKQGLTPQATNAVAQWTRALIDLALACEGSYYLPYQLHAEPRQFFAAYPRATHMRTLRAQVGATRLSNALWDKYGI